jgi:hypothetical protein
MRNNFWRKTSGHSCADICFGNFIFPYQKISPLQGFINLSDSPLPAGFHSLQKEGRHNQRVRESFAMSIFSINKSNPYNLLRDNIHTFAHRHNLSRP